MTTQPQGTGQAFGWGLLALIILLGAASNSCSKKASTSEELDAGNLEQPFENLAAASAPQPPLPMDKSAILRGAAHMKLISSIDAPGSARIYSQNCYDALAKSFDWHQLDRCGGFDAMATRWAELSVDASAAELDWFQSEAAATRYLTAATGQGQEGTEADLRWAGLEAVVGKVKLPASDSGTAMDANSEGDEAPGQETANKNEQADPLAPNSAATQPTNVDQQWLDEVLKRNPR